MPQKNEFYHDGVSGKISSIKKLGEVLVNANRNTWIHGIGNPNCNYDLEVWHVIGEKIIKLIKEIPLNESNSVNNAK